MAAPGTNAPATESNGETREVPDDDTDSSVVASNVRKGPEGKDNDSFLHEDVDKDSGTLRRSICLHWLWFSRIFFVVIGSFL